MNIFGAGRAKEATLCTQDTLFLHSDKIRKKDVHYLAFGRQKCYTS